MPERDLSDEEVRVLGLDKPPSGERDLSDEEVRALGLDRPAQAGPRPGNGVTSSAGGAAFRHVGQGLTNGFGDELGATIQAGLAYATGQDPVEFYREARRANRQQLDADMDQHPVASIAGNVAGSVVSGIATGGVGRGLGAMGQAALQGGVQGLGDSTADLLEGDVGGAALDVGKGAVLGAVAQRVGDKLGRLVPGAARSVQEGLETSAETAALKAMGAKGSDISYLAATEGPQHAYDYGRALLDEGVVRPFASPSATYDRVKGALGSAGKDIGKALAEADAVPGPGFDLSPFLERVQAEIVDANAHNPALDSEVGAIQSLVNKYRARYPDGYASFDVANELKSTLGKRLNWGNKWNNAGPTDYLEKFQKQMAGIFADEIQGQVGDVAGDAAQAGLRDANARYGPLAWAKRVSGQNAGKDIGAATVGLRDMQAAQVASSAAQGTPPTINGLVGAGAAGVAKFLRARGSSAAALALDKASTSELLERAASATPEALGKFAGVIANALQRGTLPVVHHVLMQKDPEYRALIEGLREPREE